MPRPTSPAADAATPETDAATPVPEEESSAGPVAQEPVPATVPATSAPEWGNWEFVGEHQLTYADIPVTVQPGDVIAHPGAPAADSRWQPTDAEPTRNRDNHREPADDRESADDTSKEG